MDILSDSRNQVLTVQGSFEESQNRWQLGGSHPVLCRHVVAVDVERAEDWTPLRARNLVLLLHFLPVLLLTIWILRQLGQLIGELMAVDLLDRIE